MKITVKTLKPRNPFAVLVGRRHAGRHGTGGSARRREAKRELQRDLQRMNDTT